jgi:hypothetical protein
VIELIQTLSPVTTKIYCEGALDAASSATHMKIIAKQVTNNKTTQPNAANTQLYLFKKVTSFG